MIMSIANNVYERCIASEWPSNALNECIEEHTRDQDYDNEKTTYIFRDGSFIEDCNGELLCEAA